eukprot:Skav213279  [mRNA]  locus=scaffold2944:200224:200985:+ [translate_table: standard]
MVVCAKCRQGIPEGQDTWCLGCSGWEAIERSLKGRWPGPGGLRKVGENLVVSAAKELRALHSLSVGLSKPAEPVGPPPGHLRAVKEELPEESPGTAPKARPRDQREKAQSEYSYEYEEEEEEQTFIEDQPVEGRERPSSATGSKEERVLPRIPTPERSPGGRIVKDRERSRSLQRKRPQRESRPESRRDPAKGERSGKRNKKRRGGRKHKRLHRLADDPYLRLHRGLDRAELDTRPRLEREHRGKSRDGRRSR